MSMMELAATSQCTNRVFSDTSLQNHRDQYHRGTSYTLDLPKASTVHASPRARSHLLRLMGRFSVKVSLSIGNVSISCKLPLDDTKLHSPPMAALSGIPASGAKIVSAVRDEANHVGVHVRVVEKLLTAHGGTAVHPRNGVKIARAVHNEASMLVFTSTLQKTPSQVRESVPCSSPPMAALPGTPAMANESPVQSLMKPTTLVFTSKFR